MLKLTDHKTYSVSTTHTNSMSMCNITWKDQVYLIVGKSADANIGKFILGIIDAVMKSQLLLTTNDCWLSLSAELFLMPLIYNKKGVYVKA